LPKARANLSLDCAPRARWRVWGSRAAGAVALSLFGLTLAGGMALADSADDRRVRAGARLFRALLAAEVEVESKAAPDGALHVVVFGDDAHLIGEVTDLIAPGGDAANSAIRDLPVQVVSIDTLPDLDKTQPVGIFLATSPSDAQLEALIRWSANAHVVLYSPFEGHVERGVSAGIAVEAKVQPYLNLTALREAGVELKPFFVKVAKVRP
jgi:hypothetical protein